MLFGHGFIGYACGISVSLCFSCTQENVIIMPCDVWLINVRRSACAQFFVFWMFSDAYICIIRNLYDGQTNCKIFRGHRCCMLFCLYPINDRTLRQQNRHFFMDTFWKMMNNLSLNRNRPSNAKHNFSLLHQSIDFDFTLCCWCVFFVCLFVYFSFISITFI